MMNSEWDHTRANEWVHNDSELMKNKLTNKIEIRGNLALWTLPQNIISFTHFSQRVTLLALFEGGMKDILFKTG